MSIEFRTYSKKLVKIHFIFKYSQVSWTHLKPFLTLSPRLIQSSQDLSIFKNKVWFSKILHKSWHIYILMKLQWKKKHIFLQYCVKFCCRLSNSCSPERCYLKGCTLDFSFLHCLNSYVLTFVQCLCVVGTTPVPLPHQDPLTACHWDDGSVIPGELIIINREERAPDRSGQTALLSCIVMLSALSLCLFGLAACQFIWVDGRWEIAPIKHLTTMVNAHRLTRAHTNKHM